MRAEADRNAAAGKNEAARQLRADADSLEQRALSGTLKTPSAAEILALLDAGRATAQSPRFDPEGRELCEGPLVPNEIALTGWCYIYPDEARGVADIIAVGPSEVMVIGIGSPPSPALDAAMAKGLDMVLSDPSRAKEAVALVDAARAAGPNAGGMRRRIVARFDPAIDVASATISTHRQGDGYVLVVDDRSIDISPTWP